MSFAAIIIISLLGTVITHNGKQKGNEINERYKEKEVKIYNEKGEEIDNKKTKTILGKNYKIK